MGEVCFGTPFISADTPNFITPVAPLESIPLFLSPFTPFSNPPFPAVVCT
jgi:hypothetical protein